MWTEHVDDGRRWWWQWLSSVGHCRPQPNPPENLYPVKTGCRTPDQNLRPGKWWPPSNTLMRQCFHCPSIPLWPSDFIYNLTLYFGTDFNLNIGSSKWRLGSRGWNINFRNSFSEKYFRAHLEDATVKVLFKIFILVVVTDNLRFSLPTCSSRPIGGCRQIKSRLVHQLRVKFITQSQL